MRIFYYDETGDARGIGGDRKHAGWLHIGLEENGVDVVQAIPAYATSSDWLLFPDLFAKSTRAWDTARDWPGHVAQLLLCREDNYGRSNRSNRERGAQLLDRADFIVQTGPFTYRDALTIPYVPWRPEEELLAVPRLTDEGTNSFLITGTLRAGKGQREFASYILQGGFERTQRLMLLGNSMMWFSEDLRKKLLKEGAEEKPLPLESWVTKSGQPKQSMREKPWLLYHGKNSVWYAGAYRGTHELADWIVDCYSTGMRFLHVNPTHDWWSPGHLEYTTLEALAAGLRVGVGNHVPVKELYPEHGVRLSDELLEKHDPARVAALLLDAI